MADRKFGIETLCLARRADPGRGHRRARRADLPDHLVRVRLGRARGEPVQPADLRQRLLAHLEPDGGGVRGAHGGVENGRAALACATGQAAEATAILTLCKAGDHIVSASTLYGGTHTLLAST
jgi:O-acetylhomoserine (thiol)-lyase